MHSIITDAPAVETTGLKTRDLKILAFERQWWKYPSAKETAVLEQFGLSTTRYYQVLNSIIDRSAALEADPILVRRLRRLREDHQRNAAHDDASSASSP